MQTHTGTITQVNGIVGKANSYSNSTSYANGNSNTGAATNSGDFTFGGWVKITNMPSSSGYLFAVWGDNTQQGTAAYQGQAGIFVLNSGQVRTSWRSGGTFTQRSTDIYLKEDEWYYLLIRSTEAGANRDLEIIVNGVQGYFSPGEGKPTGGSLAGFNIGGVVSGSSDVSNTDMLCSGLYFWDRPLTDEEIRGDFRRGKLDSFNVARSFSVEIEDQNSSAQKLEDFLDEDWISGISYGDETDQVTGLATISLKRSKRKKSMAPLKTDSPVNFSDKLDVLSYSELLRSRAGIEVFSAMTPHLISPDSSDYMSVFKGSINQIDFGGTEEISIECRDLSGPLIDAYIETEYEYGAQYKNDDGAVVVSSTLPVQGEMQKILDDNDDTQQLVGRPAKTGSYSPITLRVTGSPDWNIAAYKQRREPVLSAITERASQLAWICKYRYQNDTSAWELDFHDPDRDLVSAAKVIKPEDVLAASDARIDDTTVRNVVRVIYQSREPYADAASRPDVNTALTIPGSYIATNDNMGPDNHGNSTPAYVQIENPASIAKYGRKFMEVAEESSSQIDTVKEAGRFALGMIQDLDEPQFSHSVTVDYDPTVSVNDKAIMTPNPLYYTVSQILAVQSVAHTIDNQKKTTQLKLRGKPSAGFKKWLQIEARPGIAQPPVLDTEESLTDVRTGDMIATVRTFMDRTDYYTGGKYLGIRNQNFQQMTRGERYTPDGWKDRTGIRWLSSSGINPSKTVTASGTQSISFESNSNSPLFTTNGERRGLSSDIVPILGDDSTPYSFEVTWTSDSASGTPGVGMMIEWIGEDKLTIIGTSFVDFKDNAFEILKWSKSRIDGISAPAGSKFCKILIGAALTASAGCYVDSVSGYRTARAVKVYKDYTTMADNSVFPNSTLPADTNHLVILNNAGTVPASSPSIPDGAEGYDYGANFYHQYYGVPVVNAGAMNYFEVKEDGTFNMRYATNLANGGGGARPFDIHLLLVKNGTFTPNGGPGQEWTSGTGEVIERVGATIINTNGTNFWNIRLDMNSTFFAEKGDKLSLVFENGSLGTWSFLTTAGGTFAELKMRLAE